MKLFIALTFILFSISSSFSQDCERIALDCEKLLNADVEPGSEFISDGQVYTAFLDREKAEFKTTFFGGTTYRIAASAGTGEDFVIFTIKDAEGHVLFSNRNYKNAPYWDFKIIETLPVTIETELDLDLKITGCVVMLIGFKK